MTKKPFKAGCYCRDLKSLLRQEVKTFYFLVRKEGGKIGILKET